MSVFNSLPIGQNSFASALSNQADTLSNLDPTGLLARVNAWLKNSGLSQENRPIRLNIGSQTQALSGALVAHTIDITEEVCTSTPLRVKLLCICTRVDFPYQQLLGQPIEIQLVTDRGELRAFNAIIVTAVPGQSDGGAQVWMIEAVDALTFMEGRRNSRVFLRQTVVDITEHILSEWRERNAKLALAFDFDLSSLRRDLYPVREMTFQRDESDAAFLIRMWRKHGIAWGVRPGARNTQHTSVSKSDETPIHTLVLFDDAMALPANAAGTLRYHQDGAAQQRDGITLWSPVGRVTPGSVRRKSTNYKTRHISEHSVTSTADLGSTGSELAQALVDSRIDPPHWGDSMDEFQRLSTLRMQHHEMVSAFVHGASGAREAACMTWVEVQGLPGQDMPTIQGDESRQYLFVQVRHHGQNNLPKDLNERITGMFAASGWQSERPVIGPDDSNRRYANTFQAVRRKTPIVPAFDTKTDWPSLPPMTAKVVCPPGEEVYCDNLGRVWIQFPGLEAIDHDHAQGAGTSGTNKDSAAVRVAMPAANRYGGRIQLPRDGDEVLLVFLDGDPDKPLITHSLHSPVNPPPGFHQVGGLPGNRFESGNFVKEIAGNGFAQTRYDATPGQISYQAACSYKASGLTIGNIRYPRVDGKGDPRGEGFELRTDGSGTVRTSQALLLTTEPQPNASGPVLERNQMQGLTGVLRGVVEELGRLAQAHHASPTDASKLLQWETLLRELEHGSSTAPGQQGGGAPIVAVSAVAGAGILSQDNLVLGAQSHIDSVSAGHTQLTAGQQIRQRAGQGWDAFAHKGGMALTAAQGAVQIQAHADGIEMGAAKRLHQYSLESVLIEAPTIVLKTAGAQITLTESGITVSTSGTLQGKAASFNFGGGGGGGINLPGMPTSSMKTDERCRVTYAGTGEPRAGLRYSAFSTVDGRPLGSGVTDDQGFTQAFSGVNIDAVRVVIHPEEGAQ